MSSESAVDTQQEEAEVAFGIELRIKDAQFRGRQALWDLAEALYDFDECHGWVSLGYENLSQWLADSDVTMTRGTYYRYVRTWRKLAIQKEIEPARLKQLDQAKVAIVADKIVNNEVLVDDALADVEAMPASDLREKYYGPKHPATSEPETSGQVLPDEDEPIRADAIKLEPDASVVSVELTTVPFDGPDEANEVLQGEVLDAIVVGDYDWPAWVTEGGVEKFLDDVKEGADSGAQWPRITRRSAQIGIELARAWLATHRS